MKTILGIDPGPIESAFVLLRGGEVIRCAELSNDLMRAVLINGCAASADLVAIEMVACYGMPVGKETFETCLAIGRFLECTGNKNIRASLVYRKDIKLALCGNFKAKDANIRQALIDKLGIVGTKSAPGPLYGIKSHLWAALAVADYAASNRCLAGEHGQDEETAI